MDWSNIVSRHTPMVWQTVYRLLGNHADAADCFQETFLSALKVARRERVRNWEGLLRRLATARALDRLRQRLRQADRHEELADWGDVAGHDLDPGQHAETMELVAQFRHALAQLPPRQAEVVVLRHVNDLSYRQIARELGIKSNAVGVLLHRAHSRLRQLLKPIVVEKE